MTVTPDLALFLAESDCEGLRVMTTPNKGNKALKVIAKNWGLAVNAHSLSFSDICAPYFPCR